MQNKFLYILSAFFLQFSALSAVAKQVDTIDTYGVYIAAEKGYVKVEAYNHYDSFVDFKYLHEIPTAIRADQSFKVIIYEKNFHADSYSFELRPVDTVVDIRQIKPNVKPLPKADMYELTFDQTVKDGTMLHVKSGNYFSNNMGVIMLGDTQTELVKYFSQKNLTNPSYVKQYLDDTKIAFPKNAELKKLSVYWDQEAIIAKDKQDYSYVEVKWQAYQQAEKLTLKSRYLNELKGEINGYLNEHPDGLYAQEAKQRLKQAEEKLKEYEKLL